MSSTESCEHTLSHSRWTFLPILAVEPARPASQRVEVELVVVLVLELLPLVGRVRNVAAQVDRLVPQALASARVDVIEDLLVEIHALRVHLLHER